MQQHRDILINNAVLKAEEALWDAETAINNDRLTNAQNRIYYAIFYITCGLGYLNNFVTSKHKELMGWFNKKFIYEDKIFDEELFKTYKIAFENRRQSDYDFTYSPVKEKIQSNLKDARCFVECLKTYIINQISTG